ncbi:MAG TPA: hypothetical protein VMN99_10075 [Anaerolineales bacterium]|nr:hypothetical protein [Anaerolineales bacterium]
MKMKNVFVINTSLVLLLMTACSALKSAPAQPAPTQTAVVQPATGVQSLFVTNRLMIPTTPAQTESFALNVDGDSKQQPDNMFGDLLTMLASATQGVELQASLDQVITTGQLVSLHVVKADDLLNDPSVSWSLFLGEKTQFTPNFDGSDKFTVDSTASTDSPIVGSIANGHFTGGPGTSQAQIFLLGQLVEVDLIGVRLEVDLSAKGCTNGKLGGGVTVEEFRGKLLPAIAEGLNQIIKADKGAENTLLKVFDSDNNGTITTQEIETNPLLMIAASPDLDLLDASGQFHPNQDGVKDSYSMGLGFTCVPATFTAPGN